ncbi:hypothetical protein B4077_0813 [Bacillus cereus]|uniref:Uncharacterized protein n=1 Tax=Bacillus cereus TaxID=1396 RepID=A0A0G8EYK3_BACCE|nr:hypothetical protein B4077_0813 [Bacillus cereus]
MKRFTKKQKVIIIIFIVFVVFVLLIFLGLITIKTTLFEGSIYVN